MSLINIKIFGFEIDSALTAKLIIGTVGILLLFAIYGVDNFFDWMQKSLVIWTAAAFIVMSLTYGFINEHITIKHIIMITIGVIIMVLYVLSSTLEPIQLLTSVIQSIVWMTIFSMILSHLKRLE